MKRVAFTIVFNGIHHLKHNDFANSMASMFDHWVIVEGAARSEGSTGWCKPMPSEYHRNGRSIDGTVGYIEAIANRANNVSTVSFPGGMWPSKDEMVNAALVSLLRETKGEPCYLWEVDVDEQWTPDALRRAEKALTDAGAKCGQFYANFYVGPGLVVHGDWGEGRKLPYNRLWLWESARFEKHEPPTLFGGNEPTILLEERFNHYAYYFEKDVMFKDEWYGNHQGIYDNWLRLQKLPPDKFPISVGELLPFKWGTGEIVRVTTV